MNKKIIMNSEEVKLNIEANNSFDKSYKNNKNGESLFVSNNGITLISLIVTVVVLIILAGLSIYLGFRENGILSHANDASEKTNKQTATEKINLKITTAQMKKYEDSQRMPTLKELSEMLKEDDEISYVTETSQIASIKYEVGENPDSIFTKLNQYSYEFEIDSSLKLASIDGIKLANSNDNKGELEERVANLERQLTEFTTIKKATITKSSDIKELTVHSFNYNHDSAKLSLSVRLNSTLKNGESVVIGNINEKEVWPTSVSSYGVGYYGNRTFIIKVSPNGEISVRNASASDLDVTTTDTYGALYLNIFYPLFNS